MSQTNEYPDICGRCKAIVPAGQGTVRFWNGAARKYRPSYAARSAVGIFNVCHCQQCERDLGY